MKKIVVLLAITTLAITAYSQKNVKAIKKLFIKAEEHLLYEEYEQALPVYLELIDKGWDNANIHFKIGMCYINIPGQIKQAIPYLEKSTQNVSAKVKEGNYKEQKAPEEAWFYLAKAYRINNVFDKAIETYKKYKTTLSPSDVYYHDFLDLQIKTCETAKEMIKNPINFVQEVSPFNEDGKNYNPAISGNGKSASFTTYQEVRDPKTGVENFFEIVYYGQSDGHEWGKFTDISFDIESDGYFSTLSMNYEGNYMLLYRNDYGIGNIYYTKKEGNKWLPVKKLNKSINSRSNETHACISKDGNTMYFVSDKSGGIGDKDIYVSYKDNRGHWGTPLNLGDVINTEFKEETPFIAEDGKTIYFASEAHNSMGGYDIFKSVKDANGNWSQPQNLGYPINSAADDLFYLPIGDGSTAYMARIDKNSSQSKIYKITYPKTERIVEVVADNNTPTDNIATETENTTDNDDSIKPQTESKPKTKTIVVPSEYNLKGKLTLSDNKELNSSFYIHVSKPDGEVIAAISPNIVNGEFITKIKHGSYKVKVYGDGYEPAEKNVFISESEQNPDVLTNIILKPIEVSTGEYYTIKSILFDYNSDQLKREAQIEVEKLAQLMNKNNNLYIEVVGNTDSHGSDEYNKNLSIRRARAVVSYINRTGVNAERFVTKGAGKENFIAINKNPDGSDNPEGRKLNRRVDIKIINPNNDNITVENIYVPDELLFKEQLTYTIMLMESEKVLPVSYFGKSGENINNVWMFQSPGGYLYTVGQFKHKSDALQLMNLVVDAGFPNAKIISSLEYDELVTKSSNFYKNKMSSTDKQVYTIQLMALKKTIEKGQFKGLNNVKEIKCADEYIRYFYGEYIGKISAKQALNDVIDKGYTTAFVVEKNKYKKANP